MNDMNKEAAKEKFFMGPGTWAAKHPVKLLLASLRAQGGIAGTYLAKMFPVTVGRQLNKAQDKLTGTVKGYGNQAADAVSKVVDEHIVAPITSTVKDLEIGTKELGKQIANNVTGTDENGFGLRTVAGPSGSVASLFNPFSGLTGTVDYVPGRWIDLVQKYVPGEAGKTTAHMTAKAGAMTLLAAGLVGGYRSLRHLKDVANMDKATRPGKNMASQLSTTFEGDLSGEDKKQKKAASETDTPSIPGAHDIRNPGNFTPWMLSATALPLGTFLLASALTYKGVDSAFDKLRNKRLDKSIKEKEQAIKKLITARAQQAKSGFTGEAAAATEDLKNSDVYTKAASQDKIAIIPETVQLVGVTSAAILLASAIGAYHYTAASDENNIKYKAYKKALKEYAKAKSGMTPITVAPTNSADYFSSIDAAAGNKPVTPRNQPAYNSDALNKPISVSF